VSTTEAEYMAASTAARELIWLLNVIREFKPGIQARLLIDNQAAIRWLIILNSTKHISVKYHYIRDLVMEKKIVLEFIDMNRQLAVMFTKPLGPLRLKELNYKIYLN